ncbi:MAG: aminopeptidase P family protein [Azospirillaceae bacterium]
MILAVEEAERRLRAVRSAMRSAGADGAALDGFIIPMDDEHLTEYVPECARRIAWLTGFGGSAGVVVVLPDEAAIFVDGRYTLQVRDQVPGALYAYHHLVEEPPVDWLASKVHPGWSIGYDPRVPTVSWVTRAEEALAKAGATLVAAVDNPVDRAWADRPAPPRAPAVPHAFEFAGEAASDKQARLAEAIAGRGSDAAVIAAPESIAWLLNIRGGDTEETPFTVSYAILRRDGTVTWFVDPAKIGADLPAHLGNQVALATPEDFSAALDGMSGQTVEVDPTRVNAWVFGRLDAAGATIVEETDPCVLPKACKNETEIEGARRAHRRDGAAIFRFLKWVTQTAPAGGVSEIDAARHLKELRAKEENFRTDSFSAISGSGPNGAIVHYRVTPETDRKLQAGELYLIDSGGQYLDGTTDITRTVAIGEPPAEAKEAFTRVLKGHIALATTRFPKGTNGAQLDVLARRALWQAGLDYDHGTGHGVGSYLGVHEGPARISKMPNDVALLPGMIMSNEPGYYKTGAYGIRIENLIVVRPCEALKDTDKAFLEFETITLAPIDLTLIEPSLLDAEEIAWLDAYHARVYETLAEGLDEDERAWLAQATQPLGL